MANPPKKKGTGGELELKRRIVAWLMDIVGWVTPDEYDEVVTSMPAGHPFDVMVNMGNDWHYEWLAGRADRGEWYVTMRLNDALELWYSGHRDGDLANLHIESKRLARISWHSIFEKKFGRR